MLPAELDKVERIATDSVYQQLNLIRFGKESTDILLVSPITGLILMQGTHGTGFKHISTQHLYPRTLQSFSKQGISKSRFAYKWWDAKDFLLIADEIYQVDNLNIINNKQADFYELYEGDSAYYNKIQRFRLLVYRNRKIIHTIFPLKSIDPKHPYGFLYVATQPEISIQFLEATSSSIVKYFSRSKEVIYILHYFFNYSSKTFAVDMTDCVNNYIVNSFLQGSFCSIQQIPNMLEINSMISQLGKQSDNFISVYEQNKKNHRI